MKLPSESALSREQKEVISAPSEGTILVMGPPGSGKTVVAVMRERALRKQKQEVRSVVFNNVLTRYTGNETTFHSWIKSWWRTATGTSFPGGYVDIDGKRQWATDFAKAADLATHALKSTLRKQGHWHHVILDEAQDFPPDAHRLLCIVQNRVFADMPEDERPSLCLLADENQRINPGAQSTLKDIRACHPFLTANEEYHLRKNYRNTKQIAQFAAHFFVGLPTGIPQLPTKTGDKPKVITADLNASVDRIAHYVRAHPNEEVGVLVQYKPTVKKIYNKLNHRLRDTKAVVQAYLSGHEEFGDASKLSFDKPGVVTVLCYASGKGLEFDAVFLPELQTVRVEGAERDQVRMNLYVMCSRARQQLWLMVDDTTGQHEVWKILPPKDLYEFESGEKP